MRLGLLNEERSDQRQEKLWKATYNLHEKFEQTDRETSTIKKNYKG